LPRKSQKVLGEAGDNDIRSLVSISDTDIDSLTYNMSETEKDVFLSRREQNHLHIFHHYIFHHNSIGSPIGDTWLSIISNDFDSY